MKKLFSFLMVTVLVVSMLTATAFAAEAPTATLSVTGLSGEVETGQDVTVTITISGDNGQKLGNATVQISTDGLQFVSAECPMGAAVGETTCNFAAADSSAPTTMSWTYKYKVIANSGKVSLSVKATKCNDLAKNKYAAITVKEASATATVKAAETEPKPETVDKTELNKEIAKAEAIDETEYTAESYAKLKAALTAAKAVAAKADATKDEVDAAAKALTDAEAALVKKATEPTTKPTQPTQPSGPDLSRPSGGNQPGQSLVPSGTTAPTTTPEKDEVPKTADATTQVWPLAVMMVLSAAGVAVLVRKRNGK